MIDEDFVKIRIDQACKRPYSFVDLALELHRNGMTRDQIIDAFTQRFCALQDCEGNEEVVDAIADCLDQLRGWGCGPLLPE